MGNALSPSTSSNTRFVTASRAFSQSEIEDLKSLFQSLASQSQSNGKFVSKTVFQEYFGIRRCLGERLFDLATQERKDNKLSFEDLVIAKGIYEKGTKDEIDEFVYKLVDVNGDGILTRSDLEAVLVAIFDHVFKGDASEPESSPSKECVGIFLDAAIFTKHDGGSEECMSFQEFRGWCTAVPSVRKFLGTLLKTPDPVFHSGK